MLKDYVCIKCGTLSQSQQIYPNQKKYCPICLRTRRIQKQLEYYYRKKNSGIWKCPDCGKIVSAKGLHCNTCSRYLQRPPHLRNLRKYKSRGGYLLIKINDRWVLEHRYVWEQNHGEKIPPNYCVHHLDGDRTNNNPSNLYACSRHDHNSSKFVKVLQDRIKGLQKEIEILKMNTHF